MPDQPTFVVNDRRKFTAEGDLRHDAPQATESSKEAPAPSQNDGPQLVTGPSSQTEAELTDLPESEAIGELYPQEAQDVQNQDRDQDQTGGINLDASADTETTAEDTLPPGPTEEQMNEATRAYDATVDRLETAMRAANPGGERIPPMSFERLVQSLYTQALILLGGGAQPGETPRVDILGARETIDMLSILGEKSKGNLSSAEENLLQSALFDLRMGFLEITQALARQAAQRQGAGTPGGSGGFGGPGGSGPRIVR